MSMKSSLKSVPNFLKKHKSTIKRRILIYLLIMLILFPFVFVNRITIFRTILSRYDNIKFYYNDDGLMVTDYGYQDGVYVGTQITVRTVANSAFIYYQEMLDGNTTAGVYFNNSINFILQNIHVFNVPTENGTMTICNWPYDFSIYGLPVGWASAMADAKALNAIALAYKAFGNTSYLEIVNQVAGAFETPVSLGGDLYILDDGTHWYPETLIFSEQIPNYKPPLVLNGFLYALYHIYQANLVFNNSRLTDIFNLGVISAAQNIYRYDSPYNWSLYHIGYPEQLASRSYHQIHINLCNLLYNFTNVTIFKYYADKWAQFKNPPFFTWDELVSPEFIENGLLMAAIILVPLLAIDITQTVVRRLLANRKKGSKEDEN